MRWTRILPIVMLVAITALFLTGCAAKQQETPQVETVPDTTAMAPTETAAPLDTAAIQAVPADTLPTPEELEQRRLQAEKLEADRRAAERKAAEMKARDSLQVIYFAFDQSALSTQAREKLQKNAELIRTYPDWKVTVEGHCDARGSTEYNLALGERRAAAVKQYYVDYGIPAGRISIISYGEERPAVQGTGEAVWAKNRRAVTVVD